MYREKIVNIETGEETWRDYTPEEIAEVEKGQMEAASRIEKMTADDAARKAILEKLGLSEEEAKLLFS